jgi:serine protein kinase
MEILNKYKDRYDDRKPEEYSLQEYLEICRDDKTAYATAAERMLIAIGEPKTVTTSKDPRLSRIFSNRKIKVYETFKDFYGMEQTIENVVSYFRHAAQGLEEAKQILYLLGPVGSAKSSLAERLKDLFQNVPFYTIAAYNEETDTDEISPVFESPLWLFDFVEDGELLQDEYGIPARYVQTIMSPWATKRLQEAGGDLSKFKVVKLWPSRLKQTGVTKTEPGDENNQDISALVGKTSIRKLDEFEQNDPDSYSYAGGLNLTTQGVLEFVEMFKAPIKMLHPLLTATQEGNYNGTEGFGAMPYRGTIIAHSNESEWQKFKNNKDNEAFLDRVYIVKVPYVLRVTEEENIYEKLIANSELSEAPCAPGTLEMMAQFSVLSRLHDHENSNLFSKMEIYDGKNLKDKDPKAKSIQEYRDAAGVEEGMTGSSTRFAFKVMSKTFNASNDEISASPVHLMWVLEKAIKEEQLGEETEEQYLEFLKGILAPKYAEFLGDEIQKAYLEAYDEYGQNLFDRYVLYADNWIQDNDYRDPDTGQQYDRDELNSELEKIEKPAGIVNPKDFRNEIVNYVLRAKANNEGKNPAWTSYEKLREVIEKKMFANTEELMPVISFGKKATEDEEKKHEDFVDRMMSKGYTKRQVRLLVEWYMRFRKHN